MRPGVGVTQQFRDAIPRGLKGAASYVNLQDEHGEHELQAQTPGDCFEPYGPPAGRKSVGQPEHGQYSENSGEASHSVFPRSALDHLVDERPHCRRRSIADAATRLNQLPRPHGERLRVVMYRRERFAGSDAVTDFFVEDNSDGWIDRILFALASPAENDAGGPNLLALH